jgi:hypothetical protein
MPLTGKFNFRKTLFGGALTLEVEEEVKALLGGKLKKRWRRATLMDLAQPEMRPLIDMRFQPQVVARTPLRPAAAPPASADTLPKNVAALPPGASVGSPHRVTH